MNTLLAWLAKADKAFLLCLGCNGVTSFLLWFAKLDNGSYTAITLGTTGAYVGAWAFAQTKGTPTERATAVATTGTAP